MYPEELVEHLLPTIWDDSFVLGMRNPTAPDPDMPKAKYTDPRGATDFWCHLIDIRRAWESDVLTGPERVALVRYYHEGYTQQEIADQEQVSKKTINKRIREGVRALSAYLSVQT